MSTNQTDIQLDAIRRDAMFVGRLFGSLQGPHVPAECVGWAPLCVAPFMSLFVFEAEAKLALVSSWRTTETVSLMARSRHSLKLFDDTKRGLEGQLRYFREELEPVHRRRFRRPFPWPWAKDLGIFLYKDLPVSTSHAASFLLGIAPDKLFGTEMSNEIRSIMVDYGAYFGALGATLDPASTSFATGWTSADLMSRDVRADRYYASSFNGAATPDLNALLTLFRVLVNFAGLILPLDPTPDSWQTILKIRFLTLYHVLSSLDKVRAGVVGLTGSSAAHLDAILDTPEAMRLRSAPLRRIRNALMHYGVPPQASAAVLNLSTPLYGIVEACVPGEDAIWLELLVTRQLELTTSELNSWAAV